MPEFFHGVEVVEVNEALRTLETPSTSVIGLIGTDEGAQEDHLPFHTPLLLTGDKREILSKLSVGSTLYESLLAIEEQTCASIVMIRVPQGQTEEETQQNLIGGLEGYTGLQAFRAAQTTCHVTPKILIAPKAFHWKEEESADSVATALVTLAQKLRAIAIVEAPENSDALAATTLLQDSRAYMVYPSVRNTRGPCPLSPYVAGVIAKVDQEEGFWVSPSNHTINGLIGLTQPIEFALGDPHCRAQTLNEHGIATVIHHDGFRLFGNRSTTLDSQWFFLSVRRTADALHEALVKAHFWALDRNLSRTYFEDVAENVNTTIRQLKAQGALLGGSCKPSPGLNSAAELALGHVSFDIEFTPPYPTERITFRSLLVKNALEELV